ncbi:MAG: uroporphyrinogen decarboxylase family protein [Armatimonadota bacterium]
MTVSDRFRAAMRGEPVDRLPRVEWAPYWDQTLERWYTEGLPEGMPRYDVQEYLGLDPVYQLRVSPIGPGAPAPPRHGVGILEDEAGYEGVLPYLYPDITPQLEALTELIDSRGRESFVLWFTVDGFFWYPRRLFGIQRHFYAFYDHPELMRRMNADLAAHSIQCLRRVGEITVPDFVTFAEDMSYNHGPMLSEEMFEEFIAPWYRRVVPVIEEIGSEPIVDSDGDVTEMIPWLQRVGATGVLPLERQAGVDGMALRRAHPELIMIGHYDKMVMNRGEEAIRAEFERLLPLMRTGRFIPSVDHQTPPGVSFGEYQVYLRLLEEYAERGANLSPQA